MLSYYFRRTQLAGFTIIELLTVIGVVAVLAALAAPSFKTVIARYRVRTAVEDLKATIYFARAEAMKRGGAVTLAKATPTGCSTSADGDWSCGWAVLADDNRNGTLDPGEKVLQASTVPAGVRVSLCPFKRSFMTANAWGEFNGMGTFSFTIGPADSSDETQKTALYMSGGGQLRAAAGGAACAQ